MRSLVSFIIFLFEGREMLLNFAFIDLHSIMKRKACPADCYRIFSTYPHQPILHTELFPYNLLDR